MNIEKFCEINNLGIVKNITKLTGGLMHKMFKVETDKGIYAIKVLNKEVMTRSEAYDNFVMSEAIANLAKDNGIVVSSAISINNNYLNKLDDMYYMVFDFVEGKTLNDDEITISHCKKIGEILSKIHSLDYSNLGLDYKIIKYTRLYDWESYISNSNFNKMSYKDLFLNNYKKYNSILKRASGRFNESNKVLTLCHMDMDPKNVMWNNDNPIIIDWESASLANPYRELLEDALCWSGFLSNNFNEDKFIAVIESYSKNKSIQDVDWFSVICGNLVGRFGWLKYNLERSLGIVSNDVEEIKLAENEVIKTIEEINRYLNLIGTMDNIFNKITIKDTNNYNDVIVKIINNNEVLKDKNYELINAGFTNTIYKVEDYIVRICTNLKNEDRFKNEIDFYNRNKNNDKIPTMYIGDVSKNIIPYFYEVIEKINGKTLYEIWYKLSSTERKHVIMDIVEIIKEIHSIEVQEYDFNSFIKNKIKTLLDECDVTDEIFKKLITKCDIYFKENKFSLIHGDLHFDNFIYDNGKLTLLDFERCMIAPIDYDFRIFNRCSSEPWKWASAKMDMLTVESDYQDLMDMFIENYEELRSIPYLKQRLTIYEIIDILNDYKNTNNKEYLVEASEKCKKIIK